MIVNKGKIYCLKNSLNFIEFFKSMKFTELLVNVTEFFNLGDLGVEITKPRLFASVYLPSFVKTRSCMNLVTRRYPVGFNSLKLET